MADFEGFQYDFTGVEPVGEFSVVLQAGYYSGKVTGGRKHNNGNWIDVLAQSRGNRTGGPVSTFQQTPAAPGDFAGQKWMSLLLSLGFAKEKVQGKQKITAKTILGKTVYFRYEPPAPSEDPDEVTYPTISFVTKEDYEAAVREEDAAGGAKPPAATTQAATTQAAKPATPAAATKPAASKPAAPPAAPPPSTDDLDKELGLE